MEKLENRVKTLTYITVLGFILIGILLMGLYFKGNNKTNNGTTTNGGTTTNSGTTQDESIKKYEQEVAKMKEVNVEGAMNLFNEKGTSILYIGRNDCSVCQMVAPVLLEVQEALDYKTYYYDLNTAKNFRSELKDLAAKFTIKTTVNNEEDTIGNLFIKNGYTPTIVIIKNGKVVDGFIGYRNVDTMKELIQKYL